MEYQTAIIVSPDRSQAADRSPRNQISIGRDNDTQLSKPTAAAWLFG
jgi:hypothetical protein